MVFAKQSRVSLFGAVVWGLALMLPISTLAAPIDLPQDENGWTRFSSSPDSNIVYISTSGDDDSGEVYSPAAASIGGDPIHPTGAIKAFKTFAAAYAHTRDGYPDWILFKRGDRFTFPLGGIARSGRSAKEPFLIGTYGASGGCPVIRTGAAGAFRFSNTSYFAISGLDFYAHTRDPDDSDYIDGSGSSAFTMNTGSGLSIDGVLIEGCKFRFYQGNAIQNRQGVFAGNIAIRRCLFADNYSEISHSQGLYTYKVDGITLEENIFVHNGWYMQKIPGNSGMDGGQATMFNHNTYFSSTTNVLFRQNMFIEAASAGNKFTAAVDVHNIAVDNNLYIGGEIGISMGGNYRDNDQRFNNISVSNNVLTQIGMSRPTNRKLAWYFWFEGWNNGLVFNNYLLHQQLETNTVTYGFLIEDDHRNVTYSDNIIYNLQNGTGVSITTDDVFGMEFFENKIQIPTRAANTIQSTYATSGKWVFAGNLYFSDKAEGTRFRLEKVFQSLAQWQAFTGDDATFLQADFPEPCRDIAGYQAYIGEAATIDAFIAASRAQDRFNWDKRFEVETVNRWIKSGFSHASPHDGGSGSDPDSGDNGEPTDGNTADNAGGGNDAGSGCFVTSMYTLM
ncbi:MAG: hypothetical protein HKP58_05340 [Desulfatitalea sp.]|nr:hypothetical protein [Desulfatitalea sp.]NNJ99817.1 hypothetical protein [Desulfatitalea sp.]